MKRKVTNLEQKLLDNGWKLVAKEYRGKYSQWTSCYVFEKVISLDNLPFCDYKFNVKLDKHRNSVVKIYISEIGYVDENELKSLSQAFEIVKDEISE